MERLARAKREDCCNDVPVVAASRRYVGKETDRRWEQGEDLSLVEFKTVVYVGLETGSGKRRNQATDSQDRNSQARARDQSEPSHD